MLKTILLLFLFLITKLSFAQDSIGCKHFHEGKFVNPDSLGKKVMIMRSRTHEIQFAPLTNESTELKIIWLSDCEAEMKYVSISNKTEAKELLGKTIRFRITSVLSAEEYSYEITDPSGKKTSGCHSTKNPFETHCNCGHK